MGTLTSLPCGCIRGEFLCPEAVALWAKVSRVWEDEKRGLATREQYQAAVDNYRAHFKEANDG